MSRMNEASRRSRISTRMALGDLWNRTLVYFGIAEEDEWDDEYAVEQELERSYHDRPNIRRISPRRREKEFEDWTDAPAPERTQTARPRLRGVDGGATAVAAGLAT